jgi:hypothetical protein
MKEIKRAWLKKAEIERFEKRKYIFFGPIIKKYEIEHIYNFGISTNSHSRPWFHITKEHGEKILKNQMQQPELVRENIDADSIFMFRNVFVWCDLKIETPEMIVGYVLELEEKDKKKREKAEKTRESLQKKGSDYLKAPISSEDSKEPS